MITGTHFQNDLVQWSLKKDLEQYYATKLYYSLKDNRCILLVEKIKKSQRHLHCVVTERHLYLRDNQHYYSKNMIVRVTTFNYRKWCILQKLNVMSQYFYRRTDSRKQVQEYILLKLEKTRVFLYQVSGSLKLKIGTGVVQYTLLLRNCRLETYATVQCTSTI